jgi:hypothetical protein
MLEEHILFVQLGITIYKLMHTSRVEKKQYGNSVNL